MGNISNALGRPFRGDEPTPPETQLMVAMAQLDLHPSSIELDGQLHRFDVDGSKGAGWYVAFGDGVPAGKFGNWKTGEEISWIANVGRELSVAEEIANARRMAEIRKRRDEEKAKKQEVASDTVSRIWELAGLASDEHPYLKRKGVKAHGLRITGDGRLISPMYDGDGNISSVQYISSDGSKMFHPGGAVKGCSFTIGDIYDKVYVAEGFATGATIYEVTNTPTVIAYSAGNILNVVENLRRDPSLSITIVADNDEAGIGQAKAEQAAAKFGATVVVSPVKSDVNDFVQQGGDLMSLLEEKSSRFQKSIITPEMLHEKFMETLVSSWVIKDIIPESSGLTMIYGAPGTYKSFIAIDMALCMANGIEWHGKRTKQRNVLYIAAEGQFGVLKRFEVWRKYHDIENIKNISILPMAAKLDNSNDMLDLVEMIRSLDSRPDFIFFDTLARSMDGEENSKVDMGIVINAADLIRHEFGVQIVVIHHSGKDTTRGARGSNSLEGATDTQYRVEKGGDEYTAIMTCERQKDDEASEPIGFEMKKINTGYTNIDGDEVNSLVPTVNYDVVPKKTPRKIDRDTEGLHGIGEAWRVNGMEVVEGSPYIQKTDWAEWLVKNKKSKSDNAARTAVKPSGGGLATRLIESGKIEEYGVGYLIKDGGMASALLLSKGAK